MNSSPITTGLLALNAKTAASLSKRGDGGEGFGRVLKDEAFKAEDTSRDTDATSAEVADTIQNVRDVVAPRIGKGINFARRDIDAVVNGSGFKQGGDSEETSTLHKVKSTPPAESTVSVNTEIRSIVATRDGDGNALRPNASVLADNGAAETGRPAGAFKKMDDAGLNAKLAEHAAAAVEPERGVVRLNAQGGDAGVQIRSLKRGHPLADPAGSSHATVDARVGRTADGPTRLGGANSRISTGEQALMNGLEPASGTAPKYPTSLAANPLGRDLRSTSGKVSAEGLLSISTGVSRELSAPVETQMRGGVEAGERVGAQAETKRSGDPQAKDIDLRFAVDRRSDAPMPAKDLADIRAGDTSKTLSGSSPVAQPDAAGANLSPATSSLLRLIETNTNWAAQMKSPVMSSKFQQTNDGKVLQSLRIQLNPVELGTVDATLRLSDGKISLVLKVENEATQLSLMRDGQALQNALRMSGYQVDQIVFNGSVQEGSSNSDGWNLQNGGTQFGDAREHQKDAGTSTERGSSASEDELAVDGQNVVADGVYI